MAANFITTTAQMRTYEPIAASFQFSEIQPKINDVEQEFLVPILGVSLFEYLRDLATPTGNNDALIKLCRNAVTKLAIYRWLPYGNLNVQSGGFTVNSTNSTQVASKWRVDSLEDDLRKNGFNMLERILVFIWSKPSGTWTQYDECDERIEHRNWLIQTATEFNKYYFIDNNYELFCRIKPGQSEVIDQYIKPVIGEDLYDQLIDQIIDDNLSADNSTLLTYIKRAVAPLTIYESVARLGIDLSHWGITVSEGADNGDNTVVKKQAPNERLSYALRKAGDDGRKHLGKIQAFLNNNASDTKYALYYSSDLYVAPSLIDDEEDGDMLNDEDSGVFMMM